MPSAAPPAAPFTLRDLPDWMDPMLVKELRQGLQHRFFLIPFVAIHAVMLGALALEWSAIQKTAAAVSSGVRFAGDPESQRIAKGIFWGAIYLAVAYIMPLRSFEALRDEHDRGNSELLLMAGLSRWKIVRGKWMVQTFLMGITLVSLVPYMLVRYFFGAVEFVENFLQFLGVIACGLANSALLIGASGYKNYTVRLIIAGIGMAYVLGSTLALQKLAWDSAELMAVGGKDSFVFYYGAAYALVFCALYVALGLQLGRAHLRLYVVPWERSVTRNMAGLLIVAPFILLCGAVATCFYGSILVLLVVIYSVLMFDRGMRNDPALTTARPPKKAVHLPGGF